MKVAFSDLFGEASSAIGLFMKQTLSVFRTPLVIGLISLSLIALELVWTRIFSAEFYYTFAFLILSIAVMGLGLGALGLRLSARLRRLGSGAGLLVIGAIVSAIGPPVVIMMGLKFSHILFEFAHFFRFLLAVLLLGFPFFCGGVALASLFRAHHRQIDMLYMADLLGAGVGVALALVAMNQVGTPIAVFLVPLPLLLAALLVGGRWSGLISVATAVALLGLVPHADSLMESDREERAPVIYRHWDAMAKIKMFDYGPEARGINIDNVANTPVIAFDGDWSSLSEGEAGWDIDVGNLLGRFDEPVFLSLGAGGGGDVLQALGYGAAEVHAVEVNTHINRMMVDGDPTGYLPLTDEAGEPREFALTPLFSGELYRDPRVKVISEDGRAYVRRFQERFDVIYSLSSNTFAALGSGSFAFAENYLFTIEAFVDYWNALSDDGFLVMEHQFYMPRLVSDVMVALPRVGIVNPEAHIAVYHAPNLRRHILLLSKQPLSDEVRHSALGELDGEGRALKHLLYPPPPGSHTEGDAADLFNRIITQGWEVAAGDAEVDVSPSSDDRPFVAQMGLWRNFEMEKLQSTHPVGDVMGFPLSKAILLAIIAVVLAIVVPLNLLPYLRADKRLSGVAWVYFFAVGLAFMIVEIVLIQMHTLAIGVSFYSIATVLLTLLVGSALGSQQARRFGDTFPFVAIAVGLLLHLLLRAPLTEAMVDLPMSMRALCIAAITLPLAFFMGMPFVKGARRVGDLVDWGFAINGGASVLGAALAVVIAFTFGYGVALCAALAVYLAAGLLLRFSRGGKPAPWTVEPARE